MPRKRRGSNLSRRTIASRDARLRRAQMTDEQIQQHKAKVRANMAKLRASQLQDVRDERNSQRRLEQEEKPTTELKTRRTNRVQRQEILQVFVDDPLPNDSNLNAFIKIEPEVDEEGNKIDHLVDDSEIPESF